MAMPVPSVAYMPFTRLTKVQRDECKHPKWEHVLGGQRGTRIMKQCKDCGKVFDRG